MKYEEENIYTHYVTQIQRYPLLSAAQEIELSKKIQQGDAGSRMKLINSNLRLVVSIAKKYAGETAGIMDLIQEGNLGLICAASRYQHSFNVRFSTYAYTWITQYVLKYIKNCTSVITLPLRKTDALHRIKKAAGYLHQMLGRTPSNKELAIYLDVPEKMIQKILSFDYTCSSLYAEIDEDSTSTCIDFLADEHENQEESYIRESEAAEIRRFVGLLSEKEQQVMYYRYNLSRKDKPKTFRQIGELLGCSPETVRLIELRALNSLRAKMKNISA